MNDTIIASGHDDESRDLLSQQSKSKIYSSSIGRLYEDIEPTSSSNRELNSSEKNENLSKNRYLIVPSANKKNRPLTTILTKVPLTIKDMESLDDHHPEAEGTLVTVDKFYEAGNGPFYALKHLEDVTIKEFSSLQAALQYAVRMKYVIVEDCHKWIRLDSIPTVSLKFIDDLSKMTMDLRENVNVEVSFNGDHADVILAEKRLSVF
jgi:hypothetical protein